MTIPKENRQQMINMMYLVLTALLALNVSAEILNAFTIVNTSLDKSNKAIDQNNAGRFKAFDNLIKMQPDNKQMVINKDKADKAMQISKEMSDYLDGLIAMITDEADGIDPETGEMKRRDDVDISSRVMVEGPKGKENGVGFEMVKKLAEGRKRMLALFDKPEERARLDKTLQLTFVPKDKSVSWVREQFFQIPAVATKTLLLKLKNDVKSTEGDVIANLQNTIDIVEINAPVKLDKFSAEIVAPTYILQGEAFEAKCFLSAFSSEAGAVKITVNGTGVAANEDGVGIYRSGGGAPGERTLTGSISLFNKVKNKTEVFAFEPFKYTVAAPFAVVSPTKMNVFYIGVDNPVSVSAAGVSASKLVVNMSSGSISGSGGNYTVRVSEQGTTNVTVSANGKSFGAFPFRVKRIPDPIAKVGGKAGGTICASELKAQTGLGAVLENFDFDARFEVLSYQMVYAPKREDLAVNPTSGAYFSAPMKANLARCKPGDTVYFEEVKVKGPDGTIRKIPGIVFRITC